MTKEEIKAKYDEVGNVLQKSLTEAKDIRLLGEEEQGELSNIISQLEVINSNFKIEIEKLQSSSEWDKFCIAFFGETNAGKSTIIDSLRIIYNEEKRRIEMIKQRKECEALLSQHCESYELLLKSLEEVNFYLSEKEKKQPVVHFFKYAICVAMGFIVALILSFIGLV